MYDNLTTAQNNRRYSVAHVVADFVVKIAVKRTAYAYVKENMAYAYAVRFEKNG